MGFSAAPLHIDGRGHLMGRLAATVAKSLLQGQKVNIYRCEAINISGSIYRNKMKYHDFLRKRTNTMPKRGPFHLRTPSKIVWRVIRGMLPHKLKRGSYALGRLRTYEGIPRELENHKRKVIPSALRAIRLKPGRAFCSVGRLAQEVGWKFETVVKQQEEDRKKRSLEYYLGKKEEKLKQQITRELFLESESGRAIQNVIESYGYN